MSKRSWRFQSRKKVAKWRLGNRHARKAAKLAALNEMHQMGSPVVLNGKAHPATRCQKLIGAVVKEAHVTTYQVLTSCPECANGTTVPRDQALISKELFR